MEDNKDNTKIIDVLKEGIIRIKDKWDDKLDDLDKAVVLRDVDFVEKYREAFVSDILNESEALSLLTNDVYFGMFFCLFLSEFFFERALFGIARLCNLVSYSLFITMLKNRNVFLENLNRILDETPNSIKFH